MKKIILSLSLIYMFSMASAQEWTIVGNTQVTSTEVGDFDMAITDDSIVYVAFADAKANKRAQTKILKNGTWAYLGPSAGFSGSTSEMFHLKFLPNGNPILVFRDINFLTGTRVLQWDISDPSLQWRPYGDQVNGLTGGYTSNIDFVLDNQGVPIISLNANQFNADFEIYQFDAADVPYKALDNPSPGGKSLGLYDMTISPANELYIAYQDPGFDTAANINMRQRISVKKRVNDTWILVGQEGVSYGKATDISLEFDSEGTPYLAFYHQYMKDGMFGRGGAVRKFNGTTWESVGPENFYDGIVTYLDLAISPSGTPVVSYIVNSKLEAFAFNGDEWQKVGSNSISQGMALWPKIKFGEQGTLYAIFKDRANGDKATVMQYKGNLTTPSTVTSVSNFTPAQSWNIYPNPTNHLLTLETANSNEKQVHVLDATGQLIWEGTMNSTTMQLDVSKWKSGLYFIQLLSSQNTVVQSFIKK